MSVLIFILMLLFYLKQRKVIHFKRIRMKTGGLAWIPLEKFSEKSSEKEMRVIYDKNHYSNYK